MATRWAADRALAAVRGLVLASGLALGLVLLVLPAAGLAGTIRAAELKDVTVELNGEELPLETPAFVLGNRTFVPLRGLFEPLGAQVAYDSANRQITIARGPRSVLFTLDSREALVNGQPQTLDEPPLIINGRAYVPARFVTEALGDRVVWHGHRATLVIESDFTDEIYTGADGYDGKARTPVVPYTEQELDLLVRLINAEAFGEPYEGMVAVGAVVINRVLSPHPFWPDTIYDVIMQPGQFAPVWNGQIGRAHV